METSYLGMAIPKSLTLSTSDSKSLHLFQSAAGKDALMMAEQGTE